jgi:glycosyltransferase involved in cell wall biosynthesis
VTRVAIVHDYLTQRGGAERVVASMARAFPGAPVYTSFFEPASTFPEFADVDVRVSALDRIALLRRHHRLALPLLAPTFSSMRVDAEVVVCSSSGWAHGVRTDAPRVVYCYAPARWLYQSDRYLASTAGARGRAVGRAAVGVLGAPLRAWDRRAAARAARYLVTSTHVRDMVRNAYGLDAEVLAPPLTLDPAGPRRALPDVQPGFVLCVSRLLVYKHVDAVIAAFGQLPDERLVVVGTGPDAPALRASRPPNVQMTGSVDDDVLRWLYANAGVLVAAAHEDFGLTPIEANAFGVPVAALRWGGYLDTVLEERTGVLFDEATPDAIADAVRRVRRRSFSAVDLRARAAEFSEARFVDRLRDVVDEVRG